MTSLKPCPKCGYDPQRLHHSCAADPAPVDGEPLPDESVANPTLINVGRAMVYCHLTMEDQRQQLAAARAEVERVTTELNGCRETWRRDRNHAGNYAAMKGSEIEQQAALIEQLHAALVAVQKARFTVEWFGRSFEPQIDDRVAPIVSKALDAYRQHKEGV